tara:strand:- start:40 stop:165 length:126 start_codon:yes stop_codon:yes gene_type:complete
MQNLADFYVGIKEEFNNPFNLNQLYRAARIIHERKLVIMDI